MIKYLKNKIVFFSVLFVCLFTFNLYANTIKNMDIDVFVRDDGSAKITERIRGVFYDGTENYFPITTNDFSISNFKVEKQGKQYTFIDDWDIDSSFDEKKYKCGYNRIKGGLELCFGISEYGENEYIMSYDISSLVKSYNEKDGFNFMFVNPNMSTFPTAITWRLHLQNGTALTTDNARIWGFGFDGNVSFEKGFAISKSNTDLRNNNYAIIMMSFEKDLLMPSIKVDKSFEEVKKNAFIDSSYNKESKEEKLFRMMVSVIIGTFLLSVVVSIIFKVKRRMTLKRFYKESNYFRDDPNGGDMALTYALFTDFDLWKQKDSNVIAALMMKMIHDKNLIPIEEKSVGFFGIEKINTSLQIMAEPTEPLTKKLFDILMGAAGEDKILQENELKKYAEKNYTILVDFMDSIERIGHNNMNTKGCYKKLLGKKLNSLTDIGKEELAEMYGNRKFLDEFTLIAERETKEVTIWENMLIYATLYGLAKKVIKTLKKLYPEQIVEIENLNNTVYISDLYFRTLYINSINAKNVAALRRATQMANAGMGGHVSLGGGGGFSGGGMGGGSR